MIRTRFLSHGHILTSAFTQEADHMRTLCHLGRFGLIFRRGHDAVKQGLDSLVSICPGNKLFNREKVFLLLLD